MVSEVGESSISAQRKDGQQEALLHSSTFQTGAKDPPQYGAQYRQDALWEGGNEALPPMWQQFKTSSDGESRYQDDTLVMVSWNRPLPGVRLDHPGDLVVPGWEWHISPLGRSYFVNHNTRTTSWKKPKPERPAGSLMPECIIEGRSKCIWNLAYLGTGNIMSTSEDGSICQWQRDGEPAGKPLNSDGGGIGSMVVSPDETMVLCGNADGRLRLWNIEKGRMIGDPWEGHDAAVRSLDWSPSSLEIASGSEDGTIRRWNPDTGRQTTPPIETSHGWVNAVKYSPQEDRFMSGGTDMMICVWSKYGQLLIKIKGHDSGVTSLCWSEDGTHIFSASIDNTIRKWRAIDAQELVVFRGHTHYVHSLCLTPNQNYIVSGSSDYSIRIWDLKTNQPVGDPLFHDDELWAVAMSPDGKYIASTGLDKNIYVWSLEEALKVAGADDGNAQLNGRLAKPRVVYPPIANTRGSAKYGSNFFGNESDHASRRAAPPASPSFLIRWHRLLSSIHFGTPPVNPSQPIERQSRHWNFNFKLFSGGNTRHTVDVPLAQDEDRYGIVHETDAEAAAAMQRTDGNEADNSLQSGQPAGAQASQVEPTQTQTQGPTGGAEDFVYVGVSCCGIFFGYRRPASHQS